MPQEQLKYKNIKMEEPTHKIVGGKRVDLTAGEIAAIKAKWEVNANKPPEPPTETVEQKLNKLLSEFDKIKKDVEDLKKK